jgi:hypothetical protein
MTESGYRISCEEVHQTERWILNANDSRALRWG